MNHFMEVGIFWIGLNPTDLDCWRLTLSWPENTRNKSASFSYIDIGNEANFRVSPLFNI